MKPFARSCLTSLTALSSCWWTAREAAAQPSAPVDAAALSPAPAPADVPPGAPPPMLGAPGQTRSCDGCYHPRYEQPYYYAPQLQQPQLTAEEWSTLDEGEISSGRHVAGVLLALSPGFGLGQAVQGRWSERGWIFTVGEAAGIALAAYGLGQQQQAVCYDPSSEARGGQGGLQSFSGADSCGGGIDSDAKWMIVAGVGTYFALHVWEIFDAIDGPSKHNRQVRALRRRAGQQAGQMVIAPFLVPSHEGGAMAGLAARF